MNNDYDTFGCFGSLFVIVVMVALIGWTGSIDKQSTKDETERFQRGDFDGHTYIIYEHYRQFGMTHDPDCECQK